MFVEFDGRYHLHQHMDTEFGRFKMLALRTMAGEVKDDVNNATSSFKRSSMTFCMYVCLYDHNQLCLEH